MLVVPQALSPEKLAETLAAVADLPFYEGAVSAAGAAKAVKNNREAVRADPRTRALAASLKEQLSAHGAVKSYARPVRWTAVMVSRYAEGEAYGTHFDAPFLTADEGGELRADLSFTLFLSPPDSYAGGELVLEHLSGEQPVKLAAGAMVIYPTTLLHRVAPVTSGERLAAVGWMQSRLRDPARREMVFELEQSVVGLPHDARRRTLTKLYANLLKMWSD